MKRQSFKRRALRGFVVSCALIVFAWVSLAFGSRPLALAVESRETAGANAAQAPAAGSIVSSNITSSTTWTKTGSPYTITAHVTVSAGATLTIQPGVTVIVQQYDGLTVNGTLVAEGTAAEPILFTGSTPEPRWWRGLSIVGSSVSPNTGSRLSYVTIEHGGYYYANLYLEYAQVALSNSTIQLSGDDGLYGSTGGVANLTEVKFIDNTSYAVQLTDGSVNPVFSGLTATGNGTNAVALGTGTLTGEHVWEKAGVDYVVLGNQTIAYGARLTIQPGVTVRFARYYGIIAKGTLLAEGTTTQRIMLTGQFGSQLPEAAWWRGISIEGSATTPNTTSRLSYVTIEYGGYYYANLYLQYARVPVSNSVLRYSDDGIYGSTAGVADLTNVSITNNTNYAVQLTDGSVNPVFSGLTATGNGTNAVALDAGTLTGEHVWENAGVDYVVLGNQTIAYGARLTIQPGVTVRSKQYYGVIAHGVLDAVGRSDARILFTGTTAQPGWWRGIAIDGGSANTPASGVLDYVTVEYGGYYYANVYIEHGRATITNSIIRHSGDDGVFASTGGAGSVIETSQVLNNTNFGVHNYEQRPTLLAHNNWWGASTGPSAEGTCNPGGTGSRITTGVSFRPFLSSADAEPAPLTPGDTRILTLTPERWFVPTGSKAWVTVTLRDGDGNLLPNRDVELSSTLGTVHDDGSMTNAEGKAFVYVTSDTPGDAQLTASLKANACEAATSPVAKITFISPDSAGGQNLLPEEQAPYLNEGIEINPEPITRGVPTRLSARLSNPNDFPISVTGSFGFAQYGIGLAFGPVGSQTITIPAKGEGVVEVLWTPIVSGHYCVQFEYTAQRVGAGKTEAPLSTSKSQRNLNVYPGSLGGGNEKDALNKADKAFGAVSKIPAGPTMIQKAIIGRWWQWVKKTSSEISKALGSDPPRQDYTLIAVPERSSIPAVQADANVSAQRAAALNAVNEGFVDIMAYGRAATITLDRYGGAAAANDLQWSSQQAGALVYYKKKLGESLVTTAGRLKSFIDIVKQEGDTSVPVSAAEILSYQNRLRSQGWTAQELADARLIGMSDAEIEAYRQEILAADPNTTAGDLLVYLAKEADAMETLGNVLVNPPNFPSVVGGSAGKTESSTNNLARVFETTSTFQVGNSESQAATIELQVRPVDMPQDWVATLSDQTVTLGPGEQKTVTLSVRAGSAIVQGVKPRVAVEGYANGKLLGGVAVDVIVPEDVYFDGKRRVYIPLGKR